LLPLGPGSSQAIILLAKRDGRNKNGTAMFEKIEISESFCTEGRAVVFPGDCLEFLKGIPDRAFQLIVTSPPYNLGKEYEKRIHLDDYIRQQRQVIRECVGVLKPTGSICWEVGNHVENGMMIGLVAVVFTILRE